MPEQLTKHPEVTLQVLRSAGARCGEGAPQEILKQCPAQRFCKLPGGEVCVYGLPESGRMTQVSAAEWQAIASAPAAPRPDAAWIAGAAGLVVGVLVALALQRAWRARRRTS